MNIDKGDNIHQLSVLRDSLIKERKYDKAEGIHKIIRNIQSINPNQKIVSLENKSDSVLDTLLLRQKKEENELKDRIYADYQRLIDNAQTRYQSLLEQHKKEIDAIDKKCSNPLLGTLRVTSNVRDLFKAESFYANNHDFKMAKIIKKQLARVSLYELGFSQDYASNKIQSQTDKILLQHANSIRIFKDKLIIKKETLKNKIQEEIHRLINKYRRLYEPCSHLPTIPSDQSILLLDIDIENRFNSYLKNFQSIKHKQSSSLLTPKSAPRTPRLTEKPFIRLNKTDSKARISNSIIPSNSTKNPRLLKAIRNSFEKGSIPIYPETISNL